MTTLPILFHPPRWKAIVIWLLLKLKENEISKLKEGLDKAGNDTQEDRFNYHSSTALICVRCLYEKELSIAERRESRRKDQVYLTMKLFSEQKSNEKRQNFPVGLNLAEDCITLTECLPCKTSCHEPFRMHMHEWAIRHCFFLKWSSTRGPLDATNRCLNWNVLFS